MAVRAPRARAPAHRLGSTAEPAVAEAAEAVAPEVVAPAPKIAKAIAASSLLSVKGVDYSPLVESLRTGDFKTADQFTRDILIARTLSPQQTIDRSRLCEKSRTLSRVYTRKLMNGALRKCPLNATKKNLPRDDAMSPPV